MEGAPVTEAPSQDDVPRPETYTEVFEHLCPEYMAMGMTYDEFWHMNTTVHKAYRKAYEIRRRNEEWARWRQGAYFYDALMRVAPVLRPFVKGPVEPGKYPDEPWPLTQKEADDRERQREIENTRRFIAQLEAESERNLKRMNDNGKEAGADG